MIRSRIFRTVFLLLTFTCLSYSSYYPNFNLINEEPLNIVSENFLSVALDCSNIEGRFSDFNLSDPYLTSLVKHLSPMYFRVGGTYADRIVFSDDVSSFGKVGLADITFLASDYLKLYQFTQNAEVQLIYDLNSLLRNEDGTWNSSNAAEMIKFSSDHQMNVVWELGNEPDLYKSIYKTHVDATQLAKDYKILRNMLNQYEIYNSSYLVGIDMFDVGGSQANQEYLSNFLSGASDVVHAVTWHQYYFPGKSATEELFLSPSTYNYLEQRIGVVKNVVSKSGSGNKIWLGETSSAYNGGAKGMSDKFIATFLWLDKLGLGAKLGLDVIIRQTIFHDNYALIDNNYVPNPDWWVSVLYKQLVSSTVLSLTSSENSESPVRMYAHCAKKTDLWDTSAVVLFGLNVNGTSNSIFTWSGFEYDKTNVYSYELTFDGSLYSQNIKLNDQVLSVSPNGDLPDLTPKVNEDLENYLMPPQSLIFLVFTKTDIDACI
ncbi:heparanase-like [Anthonomus grandis grandis]|uniref:heparanase-like n=1 Tax=Anthonomus grandis grandis TaxID=2921223 RepID=UPI002166121A|nr:heparanase-like [Anthonomus grandis grandis]